MPGHVMALVVDRVVDRVTEVEARWRFTKHVVARGGPLYETCWNCYERACNFTVTVFKYREGRLPLESPFSVSVDLWTQTVAGESAHVARL